MKKVVKGVVPAKACRKLPRRGARSAFARCVAASRRVKQPILPVVTSPTTAAGTPAAVPSNGSAANTPSAPAAPTATATPSTQAPPSQQPPPAPATAPAPSTVPAGSPVLADGEAAGHVHRSSFEPRHDNDDENQRVPTASELSDFDSQATVSAPDLVTGNFKGTTDEVLQWVAAKWGYDPDMVRAVAYVESRWHMSEVGDNGVSFGITQVKSTVHLGTKPLSQLSTAFNADYWAAVVRDYYDGRSTWLNDVERGQDYAAGDIWGSVGAWYAGRWHTDGAERYIAQVKAAMADKPWAQADF